MHLNGDTFPTIRTLLQVLGTLPVSVASAEISFSALRRVKTWLRSKMAEDRLFALRLINVHNEVDFLGQIDHIIDKKKKKIENWNLCGVKIVSLYSLLSFVIIIT
jgi:hypothetical protein